jgi:epoxyqueuosine reductase QueG
MPGSIPPVSDAPIRFEIPLEAMNLLQTRNDIEIRHVFPMRRLLSIIRNIHRSVDSIPEPPEKTESEMSPEILGMLQEFATKQGISKMGFTKLPQNLIFSKFGVLFDNAIVLAMEMPKDLIDKAPSQATLSMVFGTYDDLGIAANRITEFIREQGFAAHADHPLGGLVLFPPLAQKAGLGHIGTHGLLITREFGPRVRLAAVYTNIRNLPLVDSPGQEWIDTYCDSCKRCIRECPAGAILEKKIVQENGRITSISQQDCFEYFIQYYGCSVCVKVCPFSRGADAYDRLKATIERA